MLVRLAVVAVEHHLVALGVVVEVEYGVYGCLVLSVDKLAVFVLHLFSRLVFVEAGEGDGFADEGASHERAFQCLGECWQGVELSDEEVSGSEAAFHHLSESSGASCDEFHAPSVVAFCGHGGVFVSRGAAFRYGEAGVCACPVFECRSVKLGLIPSVVFLVVRLVDGEVLELECYGVALDDGYGLEAYLIFAAPLSAFRCHGVCDGALREVVRRAVGGRDGGAGGDVEEGCEVGEVSLAPHAELDVAGAVEDIDDGV